LETWDDGARRLFTLKISRRRLGGQPAVESHWPLRTPHSSRCRLQVYRCVCAYVRRLSVAVRDTRHLVAMLLIWTLMTTRVLAHRICSSLISTLHITFARHWRTWSSSSVPNWSTSTYRQHKHVTQNTMNCVFLSCNCPFRYIQGGPEKCTKLFASELCSHFPECRAVSLKCSEINKWLKNCQILTLHLNVLLPQKSCSCWLIRVELMAIEQLFLHLSCAVWLIRTVPCCVVYNSCSQWYTCEQFLNSHLSLGSGLIFVFCV